MAEQSRLRDVRLKKIEELEKEGVPPFRNDFRVTHQLGEILETYEAWDASKLEGMAESFSVAGRMVALRSFGKAAFVKLMDMTGRLQVYVRKDKVGNEAYAVFKKLDVGDIIGVTGTLFRTKTNELTVLADSVVLLTKSIRALPG